MGKYQLGEWLSTTNAKQEEQMVIKTFFESYQQKLAMKGTGSNPSGYNADDEFQKTGRVELKKSKKSKKSKKRKDDKLSANDYKLDDKRPKYQHFSNNTEQMIDSSDI